MAQTEPLKSKQDSLLSLATYFLDEARYQDANSVLLALLEDEQWMGDLVNKHKVTANLGYSYYMSLAFDSSNYYYELANKVAIELKDTARIAVSFKAIAMSYRRMGLYAKSLENSKRALDLANIKKDSASASETLNTIGLMYIDLGENQLAAKALKESISLSLAVGDSTQVAYGYNNLAMTYRKMGGVYTDSSLYYNFKALGLKNILSDKRTASTLTNIGLDFLKLNEPDSAKKYLEWAYRVYRDQADQIGLLVSYNNLADLHLHLNRYQIAKSFLDSGSVLLPKVNLKDLSLDHYDLKVQVYEKLGLYKDALAANRNWVSLREEVFLEEKLKVQEVESNYQLREEELQRLAAEQETEVAQAKVRMNEQWIVFLVILVGLSLVVGLLLINFNKKLKEKNLIIQDQKKDNEHRIYNLLTRLRCLLRMASDNLTDPKSKEVLANSEAAIISAASLQEYLTYSEEETENVQLGNYLKNLIPRLQEMFRLTGQVIDFQVEVGQEVRLPVQTVLNLGLIISEIVTNSVKYAFDETIFLPKIEVALLRTDRGVSVRVADNGIGLPEQPNQGLGTSLIRRLAKFIGAELNVRIEGGTSYTLNLANGRDMQFG
ncbi:hypothetical protein GCM10009119_10800 [Algoriphagus jejuensis]|uniref:histidine kinase n=1 Tax=Algoriphagus jejuensis TaxID=419934 RepID=A0ABN1MY58_9BACT